MADSGITPGIQVARAQASANVQSGGDDGKCPHCVKQGLAIFPVVPTVLPYTLKPGAMDKARERPEYLRDVGPDEFRELEKLDDAGLSRFDESLKSYWGIMRALPAGYLYVLKADDAWDSYAVNTAGELRRMPVNLLPAEPQAPAQCTRSEHSVHALHVFTVDPAESPTVWIAFSRYRWTAKVMEDYAANKDGRRGKRMYELDVAGIAKGEPVGGATEKYKNAMYMTPTAHDFVADYASDTTRCAMNFHLVEDLHERNGQRITSMDPGDARGGGEPARTMAQISKGVGNGQGIMLMLDDTAGLTMQLNNYRNILVTRAAEAAGAMDPERSRKRIVADMIEGIRINANANPGPFYDKSYGWDRYAKHIDQGEWRRSRRDSQAYSHYVDLAEKTATDYVTWMISPQWAAIQCYDFDAEDDQSVLDHREMVSACVRSSGSHDIEWEYVWKPMLADPGETTIDPQDHWLNRHLSGMHPDLLRYLEEANEVDAAVDAASHMVRLTNELQSAMQRNLARAREQLNINRAHNEATSDLVETMAGNLQRLRRTAPIAYNALLRKVSVSLLTMGDLELGGVRINGYSTDLGDLFTDGVFAKAPAPTGQEVEFGRVGRAPVRNASGRAPVNPATYIRENPGVHLGGKGVRIAHEHGRAVVVDTTANRMMAMRHKQQEIAIWMVGASRRAGADVSGLAQTGAGGQPSVLAHLGITEHQLTGGPLRAADNPIVLNRLARFSAGVDSVLGAAALFFQMANIIHGAEVLMKAEDGSERLDGGVGVATGLFGSIGAATGLWVAVRELSATPLAKLPKAQAVRLAARFSGAAMVIEGAWSVAKGRKMRREEEAEAGSLTMASGAFAVLAGGATIVTGSLTASAVAAGATVFTIPIVGWTLAVVALIGVSVWLSIQAHSADSQNMLPLEYWLDAGSFGRRQFIQRSNSPYSSRATHNPVFSTFQEEAEAFYRIIVQPFLKVHNAAQMSPYVMAKVGMNLGQHSMEGHIQLDVPIYDEASEVVLHVMGANGKEVRDMLVIWFRNGELVPSYWQSKEVDFEASINPAQKDEATGNMRFMPYLSVVNGALAHRDAGKIFRATHIRVSMQYFPDRHGMPNLGLLRHASSLEL